MVVTRQLSPGIHLSCWSHRQREGRWELSSPCRSSYFRLQFNGYSIKYSQTQCCMLILAFISGQLGLYECFKVNGVSFYSSYFLTIKSVVLWQWWVLWTEIYMVGKEGKPYWEQADSRNMWDSIAMGLFSTLLDSSYELYIFNIPISIMLPRRKRQSRNIRLLLSRV